MFGLWSNSKWFGWTIMSKQYDLVSFWQTSKNGALAGQIHPSRNSNSCFSSDLLFALAADGGNYPQQTSATHHSWQLPIFLEWPRVAVALPDVAACYGRWDSGGLMGFLGDRQPMVAQISQIGDSGDLNGPLNMLWRWLAERCLKIFEVERRSTTSLVVGFKDTSSCSAAQQSGCGKFTSQHAPVKRYLKKQLGRILIRSFLRLFMFRV